MKRVAVLFVLMGSILAISGFAQMAGHKIIDPNAVAYGRTYAEWEAAWDQWNLSIPMNIHPLATDGDCSVGQSGPVWFLGGAVVAPQTRVRHCTVPYGKALFFPIVEWEDSAYEEANFENPGNPTYQTIAGLRQMVSSVEQTAGVFLTIDGVPVPHLERFRMPSVVFGVTLPDNNVWSAAYGTTVPAGYYYPCVDDGFEILLAPLPAGDHVIHFGASWEDITYYIHVAK